MAPATETSKLLKPQAPVEKEKPAALPATGLKVIGVGFPRTGTRSLHTALTTLNLRPCHHFQTSCLPLNFPYTYNRAWLAVFRDPDAKSRQRRIASIYASGNYVATVDFPGNLFVEDMLAIYPDAKFILTSRDDGAKWKRSFDDTIGLIRRPWWVLATLLMPSQWMYVQGMGKEWEKQCVRRYGVGVYEVGNGRRAYDKHNEWVRRVVPKEQLLDCGPDVGWERLCGFLGVEVPEGVSAYPRVNETEGIRRWFFEGAVVGGVVWVFWIGAVVAVWKWFG